VIRHNTTLIVNPIFAAFPEISFLVSDSSFPVLAASLSFQKKAAIPDFTLIQKNE